MLRKLGSKMSEKSLRKSVSQSVKAFDRFQEDLIRKRIESKKNVEPKTEYDFKQKMKSIYSEAD